MGMKVEEVMSKNMHSVEFEASLMDAADRMKRYDVGILPVMKAGKVTGVISDRDIVVRAVALGKDSKIAKVREAMTEGPVWCKADSSVEDAVRIMKDRKVRRVLVADSQDKPVGVLSVGDLAAHPEGRKHACELIEEVCKDLEKE